MTEGLMPEDTIFALDIGTRTIIGLVGVFEEERFIVRASCVMAHESRAMIDGQIHDIMKVVQGVKKVKGELEKKIGYSLTKVSIAAAGRVLKTFQVKIEREIDEGLEIDAQFISALEMEGIQRAQFEIEKDLSQKEKNQFYCVGYSVVNYYLNDYVISSLIGHKGNRVGVEVLATFLPHMVVDSLYTVMDRVGLEVNHLTLEPIAALNVAIPKDLRLLNLALVDIGAGTSDIAITKSGTVVAYAMVPLAGDEVTEAIAQHYLVDFNTAENIKVSLTNTNESITFTDILDNQISVDAQDVSKVIYPVIEQLARTIAEKILEYNGDKPPNAIFLVGGGSQVRGLSEILSEIIGLPKERVAVRNRSIAKNIIVEENVLTGPDSITPLGILVTTAITKGQDFFYVTVNGSKVKMYNSRKMSVSDALILAGFNPDQLICRSGKNLKFIMNENSKTIRGSAGKPAEIYVNNAVSNLNAIIAPGDELRIIPAEKGADGFARLSDLIDYVEPINMKINGQSYKVIIPLYVNDVEKPYDTIINEGDRINTPDAISIEEIANKYEIDLLIWEFLINGNKADIKTIARPGDNIFGVPRYQEQKDIDNMTGKGATISEVQFFNENNKAIDVASDFQSIIKHVAPISAEKEGIVVVVNGKKTHIPPKSTQYLFIDVFNYIDFDLTNPKGILALKLNSNDANYTDIIKNGDLIDIYWRE